MGYRPNSPTDETPHTRHEVFSFYFLLCWSLLKNINGNSNKGKNDTLWLVTIFLSTIGEKSCGKSNDLVLVKWKWLRKKFCAKKKLSKKCCSVGRYRIFTFLFCMWTPSFPVCDDDDGLLFFFLSYSDEEWK